MPRAARPLFHHFDEYGPYQGDVGGRISGSMIAMSNDKSAAYGLDALQTRGKLFVGPGGHVLRGHDVGEHAKDNDLVVNVAKSRRLPNMRRLGDRGINVADRSTLEEALEYIENDELVESPKNIRLHDILNATTARGGARLAACSSR